MSSKPEWYYVGQYGELGPLTLDQMQSLLQDRVLEPDTYVWREGMTDWQMVSSTTELQSALAGRAPMAPPPFRGQGAPTPPPPSAQHPPMQAHHAGQQPYSQNPLQQGWNSIDRMLPVSDKRRIKAGLLNFLPGFGRFYLGYSAHGLLQVLTTVLCGVGYIWSIVDGIYIMSGGLKYDGYGRLLDE